MADQWTSSGDIEKALDDQFGATWRAWKKGASLEQAALAAQYTKSESGRWIVTGVLVLADAVTADMLRAVPLVALENSMNLSNRESSEKLDRIRELPPLRRDAGMDPEEFSRLFVDHYKAWASVVPHPIAALATEHGIKVTTLRTWLREARLRGLLPPGRRGKGAAQSAATAAEPRRAQDAAHEVLKGLAAPGNAEGDQ